MFIELFHNLKSIKVVFYLQNRFGCLLVRTEIPHSTAMFIELFHNLKLIKVVFYLQNRFGCLLVRTEIPHSTAMFIELFHNLKLIKVVFYLQNRFGCLPVRTEIPHSGISMHLDFFRLQLCENISIFYVYRNFHETPKICRNITLIFCSNLLFKNNFYYSFQFKLKNISNNMSKLTYYFQINTFFCLH